MALILHNTRDLLNPEKFKLKILVYGLHGSGKTTFLSTVPNIGIGASETGFGKGLIGLAGEDLDYTEINSYEDFDSFSSGAVYKEKSAYGRDSLSEIVKTYGKAKALSVPRLKGESVKGNAGCPEIEDYGVM